jgi:large subunit ribosomal protein L16
MPANMPRRVKWRKMQKGRIRGKASRGNTVAFGEFGLQATTGGYVTSKHIEAGRVAATHYLHREGRVFIRIFPQKSLTKKPLETRMGKGKGEIEVWTAAVRPGTVLFEIGGVEDAIARTALTRIAHKMPVRTRLITRRHAL